MANFIAIRLSLSFLCLSGTANEKSIYSHRLRIVLLLAASFIMYVGAAPEGSCGELNPGFICDPPNCCSRHSYCRPNSESSSCGPNSGCVVESSSIGACHGDGRSGSSPGGPSTPVCGSLAGNKKCDNNLCCSKHGQCGTTGAHCYKANGCQSQCKYTPAQITGIAFGALAGFVVLLVLAFFIVRCYSRHQGRKSVHRENFNPVHRLFPTDKAKDEISCLDIVFCHGLAIGDLEKNAWKNTWRTRHEPIVCWAEEWLREDLQEKARVFSLEYDGNVSSDPSKKGHNTDVSEIANNLLQSIFGDSFAIGQSNPVVLIGHSFGGLVIKSLVVEAQRVVHLKTKNAIERQHSRRCQNFLDNIANGGFVFYAVPHSGAHNLELYIKNCDNMLKWNRRQDNSPSLLSNIHVFSRGMEELSVKFESFVRSTNDERPDDVIIYAFTEGLPMTREDLGIIVEHASATRLSGNNHYKVESANHMNICWLFTREDESYMRLLYVLRIILKKANVTLRNSPNIHVEVDSVEGQRDDMEEKLLVTGV